MVKINLIQQNRPISTVDISRIGQFARAGEQIGGILDSEARKQQRLDLAESERKQRIQKAVSKTETALANARLERQYNDNLNKTKVAFEKDPDKGLESLESSFNDIDSNLSESFTTEEGRSMFKQTASVIRQKTLQNYDKWSTARKVSNTALNIQETLDNYNSQAASAGVSGDFKQFANLFASSGDVVVAAQGVVPDSKLSEIDTSRRVDMSEAFTNGMLQSDPEQVLVTLDEGGFDKFLDTEQKTKLRKDADKAVIKKREEDTVRQLEIQTVSSADLVDLVNNTNLTNYDKERSILEQELAGNISPTFGSKLRQVIKSTKTVNAITKDNAMGDIITKMFDLNAISEINPQDYLIGMQNLREEILDMQSKGDLNQEDVNKLNNELTNKTSKKTAEATSFIGNYFPKVKDTFDEQLQPRFRFKAMRNFFYAVEGKDLPEDEYRKEALKVIDDINLERRNSALKAVKAPREELFNEKEFLKSINVTEEQIKFTMNKYGLTREQVIQRLRNR